MTTLEDDDDLTDASSPDASAEDDDAVDHDPNDTLVDVPDAEIVGDAVEMDGNDDIDLLTDGPYAPPEEIDADEPADLVVPPAPTKPSRREHRAEMKASARRVRRVVRHIDTWSVFKVAALFVACLWGVVVLASLLIWRAAVTSGSVKDTEDFIVDLGFEDFNFNPQQMFEALLSAGAVIAIAAIFFIWLLTVLFNLICDITGGLRITMIEQDLADARHRPKKACPAGQRREERHRGNHGGVGAGGQGIVGTLVPRRRPNLTRGDRSPFWQPKPAPERGLWVPVRREPAWSGRWATERGEPASGRRRRRLEDPAPVVAAVSVSVA